MLTERQKLSIEHLKNKDVTTPKEIVEWATSNLLTQKNGGRGTKRKHPKLYYQQIIEHFLLEAKKQNTV